MPTCGCKQVYRYNSQVYHAVRVNLSIRQSGNFTSVSDKAIDGSNHIKQSYTLWVVSCITPFLMPSVKVPTYDSVWGRLKIFQEMRYFYSLWDDS